MHMYVYNIYMYLYLCMKVCACVYTCSQCWYSVVFVLQVHVHNFIVNGRGPGLHVYM